MISEIFIENIFKGDSVYYIGGSDSLPPPLSIEEENENLKNDLQKYRKNKGDRDELEPIIEKEILSDRKLSDEEFEEYMGSMLSVEIDSTVGLLALFYRNLWAIADLREKLKEYEDLEEQGRLVKLPCKIGDDVYFVPSQVNYKLNILNRHSENNKVYHQKVENFVLTRRGWYLECDQNVKYGTGHILTDRFFNETWFLTKSEAEAKLKELRGKNE